MAQLEVPRHARAAAVLHGLTLALAGVFLLWLNRNQWFQSDEFDFLANRGLVGGSERGLFAPHNEHWSTLPILAYRGLYGLVGLTTYWPYALLLVLLHLAVAHLLWRTARRSGADVWVATALAAVFCLLGAGWENLLWAFQSAILGSLLAGLVHLALVDRDGPVGRRDWLGAGVACLGLACSAVGVAMVGAVGLAVLLRRGVRAGLVAVVPPAAVFVVWFVTAGRAGLDGGTPSPSVLLALPAFVGGGVLGALHGLVRLDLVGDVLGIALLAWAAVAVLRDRRLAAAPLGLGAGAVLFFGLAGLGRVTGGGDPTSSRYLYVAIALLLPALAMTRSVAGARLRTAPRAAVALAVATALLVPGVRTLLVESRVHAEAEQAWRARIVAAAQLEATEPGLVVDRQVTVDLDLDELATMRDQGRLPAIDPGQQARAEARALLGIALADVAAIPAVNGEGPAVVAHEGFHVEQAAGGCWRLVPEGGPAAVTLDVGAPSTMTLEPATPGPVGVQVEDVARGTLAARPRPLLLDGPATVRFGYPAQVTLELTGSGPTLLCGQTPR